MKILVPISRIFVGILFIISGFIKLNDPLGFSYKLQEYFSAEVLNLPFLEPYALAQGGSWGPVLPPRWCRWGDYGPISDPFHRPFGI